MALAKLYNTLKTKLILVLNIKSDKNLFESFVYTFGDKFAQLINVLINVFIISKFLGPELFGKLSYSIFIAGLIASISTFGLDKLIPTFVNEDNYIKSLKNSILIKISILLICFLLLAFLSSKIYNNNNLHLLVIIPLSILSINQIFDSFFSVGGHFKFLSIVRISNTTLMIFLKLFLVNLSLNIKFIFLLFGLELILPFLIYFSVFNSKLISAFYEKLDLKKVKSLAFKSSNLVFSALIIIVYNNLFMIYSKNIIGNDYLVGEFALLQKFTEIPISICSIISFIILPRLSRDKSNYDKILSLFVVPSILILLTYWSLSNLLNNYFDDFNYLTTSKYLISTAAIPFIFSSYFLTTVLISEGRFKFLIKINLLTLLISLAILTLFHYTLGINNENSIIYISYFMMHFISGAILPYQRFKNFHLMIISSIINLKNAFLYIKS